MNGLEADGMDIVDMLSNESSDESKDFEDYDDFSSCEYEDDTFSEEEYEDDENYISDISDSNSESTVYDDVLDHSINCVTSSCRRVESAAFCFDDALTKVYEWIIKSGESLLRLEDSYLMELLHFLQPRFQPAVSRFTARNDILKVMLPTYESFMVDYLRQEKEAGALFTLGLCMTSINGNA